VRDPAAINCREYPVKKRFMQSDGATIVQRKSGREAIAYGGLARRRTASGEFVATVPDRN
jgi:hypothetical protein